MDLVYMRNKKQFESQKQNKVEIKDSGVKNDGMKLKDQDLRQEE